MKGSIHLQPSFPRIRALDPDRGMKFVARLARGREGRLDELRIIRMQTCTHKFLSAELTIGSRPSKDLVHALIFPACIICLGVPFENTKSSATGRNAQAFFARAQLGLGLFALRDVEVYSENTVRPDLSMGAKPAFGTVLHAQAQLVMIRLIVLKQPLLLSIAHDHIRR